jgi:hypothetical protein
VRGRLTRDITPGMLGTGGKWVPALAVLMGACSQDHSVLARRDRGDPALGGTAGATAVATGGAIASGGAGGEAGASLSRPPPEPDGADVLTLAHGVVDAPRLHFCLTRVDDTGRKPSPGAPLPVGGVPFGGVVSLPDLPGLDPESDDFVVTIVAAEASEIDGLSCDEVVARAAELAALQPPLDAPPANDPSAGGRGGNVGAGGDAGAAHVGGAAGHAEVGEGGLAGLGGVAGAGGRGGRGGAGGAQPVLIPPVAVRVHDLVKVPAGTLVRGRNTLLVARGCLGGGTTLNAEFAEELCGAGYRPTRPTVAPVFAALSRIVAADRVGLQVVHATSFVSVDDTLSLRVQPPEGDGWAIAERVSPGAIAPPQPSFEPLASLGADPDAAVLEVYSGRSGAATHTQSWGDARRSSDVGAVAAGATYALVVLGPGLRRAYGAGWWNPPVVSIVETTAQ